MPNFSPPIAHKNLQHPPNIIPSLFFSRTIYRINKATLLFHNIHRDKKPGRNIPPRSYLLIVVLTSIRMAFHTILKIRNTFLLMFRADICFIVFVASIVGISLIACRMAGSASYNSIFSMIQREGVLSVECSRSPCACAMTGSTVCPKLTCVLGWFSMTGYTRRIQSLELSIFMAALTGNVYVFSSQREVGAVMIKTRVIPIARVMASRTVCTKLPIMLIIILMA